MKHPVALGPMGIVTSIGIGLDETLSAILAVKRKIKPLTLFPVGPSPAQPVGEIFSLRQTASLPRTHQLARLACDQILFNHSVCPDAIVVGTTTGGINQTESLLLSGETDPLAYTLHGANSVAADLALRYGCTGPVLTVSAACASGAMAIALGTFMIRQGLAERVLAGGVDGLCRLTYFGFKSLQLIDPNRARPLDQDRRGMSVAEGAGFVLLLENPIKESKAAVLGCGLSCDGYHPTAPHPDGQGAFDAMSKALKDADSTPSKVDYINLHGTATIDNDRSEASAINDLFGPDLPLHSSVKGAMGHSLAASGAIEAVVAALCIEKGILPANAGLKKIDAGLNLSPLTQPEKRKVSTILSNSFGFGGSNTALIIGHPLNGKPESKKPDLMTPFSVLNYACITGVGFLKETLNALLNGRHAAGSLASSLLCKDLNPAWIRRAKRLTRLALALCAQVYLNGKTRPHQLILGTGWGALSETYDFLTRLFESDYRFPSPTDFIGSVHNAPAGLIAQLFGIKGANVTTSGGDYSFEQALLSTELLSTDKDRISLVLGVDETHSILSPLFDPSCQNHHNPADGGGALVLSKQRKGMGVTIDLGFYSQCHGVDKIDEVISNLLSRLNGAGEIRRKFAAILVGIPFGRKVSAQKQLHCFRTKTDFKGPFIDYRNFTGQFAGAASIAAVLAVHWVKERFLHGKLWQGEDIGLDDRGILILNFGDTITAIRILPL
jgi:3-oxoacyl-[acyl-carrier-protein] synthase-1/3-oxoacyl-[acyl-carrier-protein] synthase II